MSEHERILVVDDDPQTQQFIHRCLAREGHQADVVPDGLAADRKLSETSYRVVVSDVKLPGMDGLRLLSRHGGTGSFTRFLMVSGHSTIDHAVRAMKLGAYDFLPKPFRPDDLQRCVESALSAATVTTRSRGTILIGDSPAFRRSVEQLDLVAPVTSTVLLTGDTGTGKEVAARYLHENSPRAKGPLVNLHCGAVPDNLLEDELFGHIRGAFTGATANRAGCLEMADGGTLLLDEIGTMSLSLQAKLLRVLQEPRFRRLGDSKERSVDVRLVAATNSNLEEKVRNGEFRADLYYRLSVFPVHLPRLAERGDDVILLGRHFSRSVSKKLGMPAKTLSRDAEERLRRCSWAGNVRHLENTIERAVIVSQSRRVIEIGDLGMDLVETGSLPGTPDVTIPDGGVNFDTVVSHLERQLILKSLEISGGNKKQAADLLGLKRTTLIEKLRRLGELRSAS
jgi:DNA-binding NtrC family response regulator